MRLISLAPVFAPVLAALHADCFSRPWGEESFRELLSLPGGFGAIATADDDPGDAAGFVLCRHAADEAEILTIGVRPDQRGRGVARLLLMQTIAEAEELGVTQMFLEVSMNNREALGLYRAYEFARVGIRKKYCLEVISQKEVRVDAFIMARLLGLAVNFPKER